MFTLPLAALALVPLVAGHGYIKTVTVNGQTTTAQKTNRQQSSFRSVSDNTGWIGSDFFSSDCAICGCSDTPGGRVAAPGGSIFADAGQGAGQTPTVKAGDTITLHVAGNPGEGWPHNNGHMQAYLGSCGASCSNVDVRTVKFFKIQSLKDGIPAMRQTFDRQSDSNSWPIVLPKGVANGKYILRSELISYGQSSAAEGNQVQLYPFCSNVEITGGGTASPATVSFPSVYANDKQFNNNNPQYVPGPAIDAALSGTGSGPAADNGSNGTVSAQGSSAPAVARVDPPASSRKKCKPGRKSAKRSHGAHRRHHARRSSSTAE